MTSLRIFVIGGHGRVALQFTKYASQAGHTIISQMRDASQSSDLPQSGPGKVIPLVKSLEDLSSDQVSELFKEHDPSIVLFAAGAGGKGGAERTFKVDRDGAIKVFDAIEKSGIAKNEKFRRLLLVSAVDVRDVDNTKPEWYGDEDFATSKRMRDVLGTYMQAKYEADLDLSKRSTFPWTVLRPSTLSDEPLGKVSLGRQKTIVGPISREGVGLTLLKLAELPTGTQGADGKMWDLVKGEGDIQQEVDEVVSRNTTDWVG